MNIISKIENIASANTGRIFIIDAVTGRKLTYGEFHAGACAVAGELRHRGLKKGDRAAVMLDNSVDAAMLYFACLYSGVTVVPVNPQWSADQIDFTIRDCAAKMLFTSPGLIGNLRLEALRGLNVGVISIEPGVVPAGVEKLDFAVASPNGFVPFEGVSSQDEMIIVYTSGTTSAPKAAVHRIETLCANGLLFIETLGITPESRFYNILPMTYLGGYYNLLLIPFLAEGSVVIGRAFSAETALRFWDPVAEHGVNTLWVVPTIMAILLQLDRSPKGADYSQKGIRLVLAGTAPLPRQIKAAFEQKYGVTVYENFGLSETFFISVNSPRFGKYTPGVGRILPGVKVRIVDIHGGEAAAGEEGEIEVATPYLMKGYYNSSRKQPELLDPRKWFQTGDVGYISPEGELYITGRKKDLIIRGGINISPTAIENVIYREPAVAECAVVGIPHKLMGEEIVAVVRLREGAEFGAVKPALETLCKTSLSSVQQPGKYVHLPEFPHTSSGKIQKNKLRVWLEERKDTGNLHASKSAKSAKDGAQRFFRPSKVVSESVEAMSIKYNTMVYELKQKKKDVTVLSLGEAFFDIPLYPFDTLPFPDIYHYSHSRGVPELRECLAKYFLEQYEVSFDPDKEILVTAGSKIAIHMAIMAVLNPGDEAIIHEPAWVSYPEQVKLCYGVPVRVPYDEDVFNFERYITNRTRLIIINNPNNPTGKVFSVEELSHLYKLAEKYNLFILSDEAYSDFLLDEEKFVSLGNLDREKRHTIICNSISKNYGISGWRLGYVITNADLINQILKVNQHLITCPATILEHYIARHFYDIIRITKPQISALVKKRLEVSRYMSKIGLKHLPGTATFYFFVSTAPSSLSSEEFCTRLLNEHHISTVPGLGYGDSCDKFIRVSVGTESMQRIAAALDMIKALIDSTSRPAAVKVH